jgi:hypothetical protein
LPAVFAPRPAAGTLLACAPSNLYGEARGEFRSPTMFRIYEWNFSSTAEVAVGVLLVLTILSVAFV